MDDQILPLAAPEYLRKDIEPLMYKGRQPTVRDVYEDALYNHLDIACYYDGNLIECVDKPVIGGYRVAAGVMCNGVSGQSEVTIIPLATYKPRIPFIPLPPKPKPAPHPPGGLWWDDETPPGTIEESPGLYRVFDGGLIRLRDERPAPPPTGTVSGKAKRKRKRKRSEGRRYVRSILLTVSLYLAAWIIVKFIEGITRSVFGLEHVTASLIVFMLVFAAAGFVWYRGRDI